jgi:[protein-PII] uridylyltransferase
VQLAHELGWKASAAKAHGRRLPDSYWLAEPLPWQVANARQVALAEARIGESVPSVTIEDDPETGATRVSVFTADREGLFYRICAGVAAAGANIIGSCCGSNPEHTRAIYEVVAAFNREK